MLCYSHKLDLREARAFVSQPVKARRIIHRFRGFDYEILQSDCVVIMPELAIGFSNRIEDFERLLQNVRRVIICFDPWELWSAPKLWRILHRRAAKPVIVQKWNTTVNYDGLMTAIAVFDVATAL
ncbi:MAG: hypothetical protein M3R15_20985 [Acidobacteriota bacterium]|nr:hypothetical protein [Acidobacteriota bacterium]